MAILKDDAAPSLIKEEKNHTIQENGELQVCDSDHFIERDTNSLPSFDLSSDELIQYDPEYLDDECD